MGSSSWGHKESDGWAIVRAYAHTHTHTHTHTHITDYHMQGVMGTFLEVKALLITTWSPGLEGANDDGTGPASLQQQLVPRLKRGHMARQEEGLFAQGQLASLDYFCYFSVLVNLLLDAPLPWWLNAMITGKTNVWWFGSLSYLWQNHVYLIFAITVFLDNIEREFSTQHITLNPCH